MGIFTHDVPLVGAIVLATALLIAVGVMARRNQRVGCYAERLEGHVAVLEAAVEEARLAFRRYELIHAAKGPVGEAKAAANGRLADDMDRALRASGYQRLGPLQEAFETLRRSGNTAL